MQNEEKKRYGKWIIAGIVVVCLLACAAVIMILHKGNQSGADAFDAYMDDLFKEEIVQNTINLHYTLAYPENYGITNYDVFLGDYSIENMEESYQELKEIKEKLLTFDVEELTESQQLTYDVLMDYVETELSVEDLLFYTEVLGPTTGYQAQLPIILAEYTFRTKQDIEDYLALIAQVDEIYAEIIEFEEAKADAGLFMSDEAADAIIEQCEGFIEEPEENYMIEIFNDKIDSFEGLSEEEKEEYREKNYTIITTEVVDGYQTLIDGLTELKGSGTNELGLCYFEDGKKYYKYLVRTKTGSDVSIKKQQKRIENYLEGFFQSLYNVASENPEIFSDVLDYQFPDMEPDEILQDLIEKTGEDFPEPPQVDYTIKYVHPSMQEHLSPAFYLTTPIDDIQNNLIYINEKYTGTNAGGNSELYTTLAHEGYPGHLYQNAYTASCDLPLVRNLLSYGGYTEGWATYVEYEYSYKYIVKDEALADFLAANTAASLAVYAYIDLSVHYDGWDRADVSDFLALYFPVDEETVNEIYDRIVQDPANYLSYFIGYLEFLELRETAEKKLEDNFDVKDFHAFLLSTGPAPFYIIEDYMQEWIEQQQE